MKEDPLVMCVTNTVASDFTANCLLAIGAKPAMMEEPCEAEELAAYADAALVNVGTVTVRQAETMRAAIRGMNVHEKPWVLDPVAAHILAYRRGLVAEFLAAGPALVRGNHAEIDGLAREFEKVKVRGEGEQWKGKHSTVQPSTFNLQPATVAKGIATLATGVVDTITGEDGRRLEIAGGVPMLQAVTATGCAQGAICAAFLGKGLAPFEAAKAASELMKRAGERAWEKAKTPGAFKVALVDALWALAREV